MNAEVKLSKKSNKRRRCSFPISGGTTNSTASKPASIISNITAILRKATILIAIMLVQPIIIAMSVIIKRGPGISNLFTLVPKSVGISSNHFAAIFL